MSWPGLAGDWWVFLQAPPWGMVLLLKGTLILSAAWLGQCVLRAANPRWRVLLWRSTLVSLILLPFGSAWLPEIEFRVPVEPARASPPPVPLGSPVRHGEAKNPPARANLMESIAPVAPSALVSRPSDPSSALSVWVARGLMSLWIAGILLALLRFLHGHSVLRRVLRQSWVAPKEVREELRRVAAGLGCVERVEARVHPALTTPMLAGHLRPRILLPQSQCGEEQRHELAAVLAHELSHLRGRDLFWSQLLWLSSVAGWFHPLMWGIRRSHDAASEEICDNVAARWAGGAGNYSRLLARAAVRLADCPSPACALPMVRKSEIMARLGALGRQPNHPPLGRGRAMAFLGCALLVVAGTASASILFSAVPRIRDQASHRHPASVADSRIAGLSAAEIFERLCFFAGPEPQRRSMEEFLLGSLPETMPVLQQALRRPEGGSALLRNATRRQTALLLLKRLGPAAAPALPELTHDLGGPFARQRALEAEVLGAIGPSAEGALPGLIAALQAGNWQAGEALLRIAPGSRGVWEAVRACLEKAQRDEPGENVSARWPVTALGRLPAFGDESLPWIEEALWKAPGRADLPASAPNQYDEFQQTQQAAVLSLRDLGSEAASGALRRALEHPDAIVRLRTAEALFRLRRHEESARGRVLLDLDAKEASARSLAASVLGNWDGKGAAETEILATLLRNDPAESVRAAVARTLGHFAEPREVPRQALEAALNDPAAMVRLEAALSLGKYGDAGERVVRVLIAAARGSERDRSIQAGTMLARLGVDPSTQLSGSEVK